MILLVLLNKYILFIGIIVVIIKTFLMSNFKHQNIYYINNNINENKNYDFSTHIENITDINNIFLKVVKVSYYYSIEYDLIETKYYIEVNDNNNNIIKPSDFSLYFNLHILCDILILENEKKVYSFSNIEENKFFFCYEYINMDEHVKFGIKIFKNNEIEEEIESFEKYFFTDELIKNNLNPTFINNNKFNINYLNDEYNNLLNKINGYKRKTEINKFSKLKISYLKPPLCYLKRDIAQIEGKWYYNNIYGNYFCFCRDENCINLKTFYFPNYQYCKYYFYLTIIDNNRYIYQKTSYLLSDFFNDNIEPSDAFPIFKEMKKKNFDVYYLTTSKFIFNEFCSNNKYCYDNEHIIYGVRTINGDILERFFGLFLKLKVVITAEQYNTIDNIFYNIEYITYIFLGHGVQYIKSYLYKDYLSYKKYDKMLLPPCQRIIDVALKGGWKNENIIKIGLPKWDTYDIYNKNKIAFKAEKNIERAIFIMFTWRKVKKGQNMSELYYDNLNNILYNSNINKELQNRNINIYFCYHHNLKEKRKIKTNTNIRYINQNDISYLLKNSSLIITDFSAIMFDAIIQKKPLILYIPDALDTNLKDKYLFDYYETIMKIKKGMIYLYEIFFDLNDVINKIIYYIVNDFALEKEKLKYYNEFKFKNKGNTNKFLRYIKNLK